jgi:hypothetical protein
MLRLGAHGRDLHLERFSRLLASDAEDGHSSTPRLGLGGDPAANGDRWMVVASACARKLGARATPAVRRTSKEHGLSSSSRCKAASLVVQNPRPVKRHLASSCVFFLMSVQSTWAGTVRLGEVYRVARPQTRINKNARSQNQHKTTGERHSPESDASNSPPPGLPDTQFQAAAAPPSCASPCGAVRSRTPWSLADQARRRPRAHFQGRKQSLAPACRRNAA